MIFIPCKNSKHLYIELGNLLINIIITFVFLNLIKIKPITFIFVKDHTLLIPLLQTFLFPPLFYSPPYSNPRISLISIKWPIVTVSIGYIQNWNTFYLCCVYSIYPNTYYVYALLIPYLLCIILSDFIHVNNNFFSYWLFLNIWSFFKNVCEITEYSLSTWLTLPILLVVVIRRFAVSHNIRKISLIFKAMVFFLLPYYLEISTLLSNNGNSLFFSSLVSFTKLYNIILQVAKSILMTMHNSLHRISRKSYWYKVMN